LLTNNSYKKACFYLGVNSLARLINNLAEESFSDSPVSVSYGHIILMLDLEKEICQKTIADEMKLKTSSLSRMMLKLVKQGLIAKRCDGRKVYYKVTPKGEMIKPKIHQSFDSLNENLYKILGEEKVKQSIDDVFCMIDSLSIRR